MFNPLKYRFYFHKTRSAIALLVLCFSVFTAQVNLISNPSFEDTLGIPKSHSQLTACLSWTPQIATPDFFSSFSPTFVTGFAQVVVAIPKNALGFQYPKHGSNFTGIFTKYYFNPFSSSFQNYYESMTNKLGTPLLKNHVYDFKLFYSLADGCGIASNQLQVKFTTDLFAAPPLNYITNTYTNSLNFQIEHDTLSFMTDTSGWTSLSDCFVAEGGEQYMSIGNFRSGTQSKAISVNRNVNFNPPGDNLSIGAYYYIDDLSLYDLGYYSGAAKAKKDTTLCFNTSYVIGNNVKDSAAVTWWPNVALSCTNCPNPIANPTITTKYYVQKTIGCISSKDSILITVFTPSLNANAGTQQLICVNDQVQLGINDANSFTTYTWQPINHLSCFNCPQPIAQPFSTITYTLNKQECAITTTSTVEVLVDNCKLQLPQAFSPNGDGINEQLIITIPFAQSAQLTVFNRWGSELYSTSNNKQGSQASTSLSLTWDGKAHKGLLLPHGETGEGLLPSGTYYYLIEVTQLDGTKKVYKEFVVLVR
jgi:gliding motility-associated-like protein